MLSSLILEINFITNYKNRSNNESKKYNLFGKKNSYKVNILINIYYSNYKL